MLLMSETKFFIITGLDKLISDSCKKVKVFILFLILFCFEENEDNPISLFLNFLKSLVSSINILSFLLLLFFK